MCLKVQTFKSLSRACVSIEHLVILIVPMIGSTSKKP